MEHLKKMQEHLYKATDVSNVIQNGIITYKRQRMTTEAVCY